MSGIKLEEMDASDMIDVIHFFFEEDTLRYQSGEQAEAASNFREKLYDMYGHSYKYSVSSPKKGSASGGRAYVGKNEDYDSSVQSYSTEKIKPYIPPTKMDVDSADPFGGVLDSPLR